MNPLLDVSELLTDPDFVTTGIICTRNAQTVGENGIAVNAQTTTRFSGVVTNDKGDLLERMAAGERIKGNITIHTRFQLRDGGAGYSADIVTWNGSQYTVSMVLDWSTYGRGFIVATCDLLPLSG